MSFEPPFDIEAVALRLLQGPCTVATLEADLGLRQPNLSQQLAERRDTGVLLLSIGASIPALIGAGLLVRFGARLGSGC